MVGAVITELPDGPDIAEPEPIGGPDHPMRKVTRQVAFEDGWSPGRAAKVAELFDSLAPEWSERHVDPSKSAPVLDALARGGLDVGGNWAELGAGTGAGMRILAGRVGRLVAMDLSPEMLGHAPDLFPKVRADASDLPFPDGGIDTVLAINMLLFPAEVARVLAPGGALLWVNTLGNKTPIHLSPSEVVAALPGTWEATTARAGTGFWAVVRRSDG